MMIKVGRGISFDVVKAEETGKKCYYFVLNFIELGFVDSATRRRMWLMKKKVLFVARCNGSETADELQNLIHDSMNPFNTIVKILKSSFAFLTDCAAKRTEVFGDFVLPNRVPFSELYI